MQKTSKKTKKRNGTRKGRGGATPLARNDNPNSRPAPLRGNLSPAYGDSLVMYRNICSSDSMIVSLRYVLPLQTLSAAGGLRSSVRLTSNAYDVDSALASTAMAGFGEYALLFARFRTLQMSYDVTFVNKEAFAVSAMSGFQNTSIASGSYGANYTENPYNNLRLLGTVQGNNTCRIRGKASIAQMCGTKQAIYDDLFTGSTTSSTLATAGTCWLYFAAEGLNNITIGVDVQGSVTLQLHFYRRGSLIGQIHDKNYQPPQPGGVELKRYGPLWNARLKASEHFHPPFISTETVNHAATSSLSFLDTTRPSSETIDKATSLSAIIAGSRDGESTVGACRECPCLNCNKKHSVQ